MKETITAKELEEKSQAELERVAKMTQEEARDMIVQQARKMEKSDDVQEHFYGFGMEGAMTSLAIYLNA